MKNFYKKNIPIFLLFFVLGLYFIFLNPDFKIFAQTDSSSVAREERKTLEEELKKLEEQITQYEKDINKTQQEKKTLQNKISILKNQIKKLDLQIYQTNVVIDDLNLQIKDTEGSIEQTAKKIDDSKQKLSNILRTIYEQDQRSYVDILLSEGFSNFFNDLTALETLNSKNKELLNHIKSLKSYLEDQKKALDDERDEMEKMVIIKTLQKQEGETTKKEQENVLKVTQGKEEKYQNLLSSTKKRAQEIRSRIFELIGVPKAPTFGEALEIANFVSSQTGIRPALLLAVLTQESNIGKNVGQCYLVDLKTGQGVRAKTGAKVSKVMSPSRDVPHFLNITKELNRDPYNTPVSCPMQTGWGGAMGPAQFIPSTWVMYKSKVFEVTGVTADPWNIKDAFLATGIYLKDLGGTKNEFSAVMKYFSGASWRKWEEFYGRSVLAIASQYEEDIKELEAVK